MDLQLVWHTLLIFFFGTLLLRISGRKSISQMTIPETVIMIAIGTLLIEPVTGRGLWVTFGVSTILILALLITEYIQLKFDKAESAISGKAVIVIENGIVNEKSLKKLRLSVDKLEARLRQVGITTINDVQYATLESSGQLGYTLKSEKQPATKADIQKLIQLIQNGQMDLFTDKASTEDNNFIEILHENISNESNHLQLRETVYVCFLFLSIGYNRI
ncbi:DUF421 domain-containing protein [Bacillus sp. FJAT-22090]|uniref:DUF421 domain-containing protein n=1 Tax=Bacillus sp. FJAT-22090 TaxID=1581038 RepID=UPI0011A5271F|nr:DUF421 domain-containing protein [Bacillus sp. FJAT-22090]